MKKQIFRNEKFAIEWLMSCINPIDGIKHYTKTTTKCACGQTQALKGINYEGDIFVAGICEACGDD